jgi:hypothetical protein
LLLKGIPMFEIKKGIPLPVRTRQFTPTKYPFASMAIGDYIEVPIPDDKDPEKFEATVRSSTSAYASKNPCSFSLQRRVSVDGSGMPVIGVWMTAKRAKAAAAPAGL